MNIIKQFFARKPSAVLTAKTWPEVERKAAKRGFDANTFTRRAYLSGRWIGEFGQVA